MTTSGYHSIPFVIKKIICSFPVRKAWRNCTKYRGCIHVLRKAMMFLFH